MCTVIGGFLTQYYFILFCIPLAVCTMIYMLKKQLFQQFRQYLIKMFLAGLISLILWPFALYHIFFGYRGSEAASLLFKGGLFIKLLNYFDIIKKSLFCGSILLIMFFLVITIIIISVSISHLVKTNGYSKNETLLYYLTVIPSIIYFFIVVKIAPSESDRYIMCLFPLLSLCIAYILTVCIKRLCHNQKQKYIGLLLMILSLYLLLGNTLQAPNYAYLEQKDMIRPYIDAENTNCLFILGDDAVAYAYLPELIDYAQVLSISYNEIDVLKLVKPDDLNRKLLLYIQEGVGDKDLLQNVCANLNINESQIKQVSSNYPYLKAYMYNVQ